MKKLIISLFLVISSVWVLHSEITPYKTYWINSVGHNGFRIENRDNSVVQGNNVQLARRHNQLGQRWRIEPLRNGYILKSDDNERFVLDNTEEGNNITIKILNGTPGQIWLPEEITPGSYVLRNSENPNLVVSVGENRNLEVKEYYGEDNQLWTFTEAEPYYKIEKDKNGRIILQPHDYEYVGKKEVDMLYFSPYDEPGECSWGSAPIEPDGSRPTVFGSYGAYYDYDGTKIKITVNKDKKEVWSGTVDADGKSITLSNGATTRQYKILR